MMLCVTAALLVCVGGQIGGAKTATAAPGGTKLAFRTAPGAVSIPAGQTKQLGTVNVGPFERIRVVADERTGSGVGVTVRLTIMEGSELVAQLDTISLTAKSQVTRVYD
jgi:hypothetical protein